MTPATIQLWINSTSFELPASATLADAVALLALTPPFAAAVNLQFVPSTQYQHTPLHAGDCIDLIAPITGG